MSKTPITDVSARIGGKRAVVFVVALVAAAIGISFPTSSQAALNPNALFVSPSGSASAAGTAAAPTSLVSAITRISAGGTIYLRGGTYNLSATVAIDPTNVGTADAVKGLSAYPGETPVLNFSAQAEDPANRGLAVNGSYWHVYGLIVERAGDNGIFVGGHHNVIERTITRFNRDTGLQISRAVAGAARDTWPSYNLILSAESHDNADSDGEDADGFAAKLTSGPGNVFRYAVSHNNIDDGWDLYTKTDTGPIGVVTIEDSLAYNNGTLSNGGQAGAGDRNGFKLGGEDIGVDHIVRRNIAVGNGKHGFTYNRNLGKIAMSDNVSIGNTQRNYTFDGGSSVFKNNLSCSSGDNDRIVGSADATNSFWAGTNSAKCSAYAGALGWRFDDTGKLVVTFGGTQPPSPTASSTTSSTTSSTSTTTRSTSSTTSSTTPSTSSTSRSTTAPTTTPTTGVYASDDFEDGNADGWTPTGGTWSVASDGSQVYRQSSTSGLTSSIAGSTDWTQQSVQVRVKSIQVGGSGQYVALLGRVKDASNYYALTLRDANRVELRKITNGSSNVLTSTSFTVETGKFYTLRLEANGAGLKGYVDGVLRVSANNTAYPNGAVGVSTFNGSASFDDAGVTTSGGSAPSTTTAAPTTSVSPTSTSSTRSTTSSTSSTRSTTSSTSSSSGGGSLPAWPTATSTVQLSGPQSVSGSFDGGLKRYQGEGGSQSESQDPLFILADGATLRNVIIGNKAGDGIHCLGTCTLTNVWWEDVGEDAATFKGTSASQTMTIDGGGARSAADKTFQHNGPGTMIIKNFQFDGVGKVYRSCGNCSSSYKRDVVIDNITVKNVGEAIVGINSNFGDTAKLTRVTVISDPAVVVCQKYKGVGKGSEPTKSGVGTDSTNCLYQPSDITYR